jgi:cell division septation protein DedD
VITVEMHETDGGVGQAAAGAVDQVTDSVIAPVEADTTWRDALSAYVRPSDHHVSDEDIFAALNGGREDVTAAELCAAIGVTVPMYCVWKSKYRQLDLDQLRQARRRELRRRYMAIGFVLLAAVACTGAIGASLVWAVSATFAGPESSSAAPALEPDLKQGPLSASLEPNPVPAPARSTAATRQSPANVAAAIVETGYRIQVIAAETIVEGHAVVARLASQGYPAYLTRAVVGNKDVFRVRIGPFDTLSAAEEIANQLRSAGYGGAWIAR